MGLFSRIKQLGRADQGQADEPGRDLGDLVEPGSVPPAELSAIAASSGGAGGLDQLKGLEAAGLVDAGTLDQIESTMANATAQMERMHAAGMMSDEAYAQAMASISAATGGAGASIDGGELALLQQGEPAPATVLARPEPTADPNARQPLRLEVHPTARPAYEVDCDVPATHPAAKSKVGDSVQVKIDPADPKRVAIDWAGFGA
jgi:hypothetical protein